MLDDIDLAAMIGGFSGDTEVRTDHGWKPIGNVDPDHDRVLSLDPESFAIGRSALSALSSCRPDGPLLRFHNRRMDLLAAADQPMLVWYRDRRHRHVPMRDGDGRIFMPPTSSVAKSHLLPIGGFPYAGGGAVPEMPSVPGAGADPEAFLEFLGYYLAAGRLVDGDAYFMGLWRNEAYASDLFSRAGIGPVVIEEASGKRRCRVRSGLLAAFLEPFGPPEDRHVPREYLNLGPGLLESVLKGFAAGAGSGGDARYVYSAKSRRLLEGVQEILLKTRGRIWQISRNGDRYMIALSKQGVRGMFSKYGEAERAAYDGDIFRLALDRDHVMLVRRNGVAAWCGDCSRRQPEPLRTVPTGDVGSDMVSAPVRFCSFSPNR